MAELNDPWSLEGFLDALVVELDRAQDTLAVKAINRPLTYSVKDVELELQIFPTYAGEEVRFRTAQAGDVGSSRISLQLGSITDRMIRETTRTPEASEALPIEEIEGVDAETIRSLEKIGVTSTADLERIQDRKVAVDKVGSKKIGFGKLADVINRSRRRVLPPRVLSVDLADSPTGEGLRVSGENLSPVQPEAGFPVARLDGEPVPAEAFGPSELWIHAGRERLGGEGRLEIALDRHTVLQMNVRAGK